MWHQLSLIFGCLILHISFTQASSWLRKTNLASWQLNPQVYLLGAAPKCTQSETKLSPLQNAMCTSGGYQDHMSSVNVGLLLAVNECQHQFRHSLWNCSSVALDSALEGVPNAAASKEDAFVHAATSAGIAHTVSRGCRNGLITKCGCSKKSRPKSLEKDWVWGGCGDNVEYGYQFASGFVDLRESESNHPKRSPELAMKLMNKHNNEAGRRTVYKADTVSCKCHGVSGSCSIKTCWQELSAFRNIGDKLKDNYDTALKVEFNRDGTRLRDSQRRRSKRRAKKEELIYIRSSANFCLPSNETGVLSTSGRECDSKGSGENSCDVLCCGNGYSDVTVTVEERCNCKFQWCCFVQCEQCSKRVRKQICK